MSKSIQTQISHEQHNYQGGTNVVFTDNTTGNKVSVCQTDYGLIDVKGDNGQVLYTGSDATEAKKATTNYLRSKS